ncbi:alanine racemase domain-containing protein [Salinisphaera sp. PC39]|uniref:YggS family pyridoxal phosphate-dependent enzyme n=1 Tax=Salinisphaera sp. PC39 TaxID=1304156 RepID=UPI003342436A
MSRPADNLERVRTRIIEAAHAAGRPPDGIRLVAVSKTRPADDIAAAAEAGQRDFGENYLQEALPKIEALRGRDLTWHFIGPIQSNKTRDIAAAFDWVHSVDRFKIARRLSDQRPDDLPPLEVCLQVNIDDQASKSGVAPADALELARAVAGFPRLRLRGLMAIPAPSEDPAAQRAPFAALRRLRDELNAAGLSLDTLSMGMTGDLEAAVAEGATIVRVGTAVFGERPAA